jgi:hypothetical protein
MQQITTLQMALNFNCHQQSTTQWLRSPAANAILRGKGADGVIVGKDSGNF